MIKSLVRGIYNIQRGIPMTTPRKTEWGKTLQSQQHPTPTATNAPPAATPALQPNAQPSITTTSSSAAAPPPAHPTSASPQGKMQSAARTLTDYSDLIKKLFSQDPSINISEKENTLIINFSNNIVGSIAYQRLSNYRPEREKLKAMVVTTLILTKSDKLYETLQDKSLKETIDNEYTKWMEAEQKYEKGKQLFTEAVNESDINKKIQKYKEAIENGYEEAQLPLAVIYFEKFDPPRLREAKELLEKLPDQSTSAKLLLADILLIEQKDQPNNIYSAYRLYESAKLTRSKDKQKRAEDGIHRIEMQILEAMRHQNINKEPDAVFFFKKGEFYLQDKQLSNLLNARVCFEFAAKQGSIDAVKYLLSFYRGSRGPINFEQPQGFLEIESNKTPAALFALAECYFLDHEYEKAKQYFDDALKKNSNNTLLAETIKRSELRLKEIITLLAQFKHIEKAIRDKLPTATEANLQIKIEKHANGNCFITLITEKADLQKDIKELFPVKFMPEQPSQRNSLILMGDELIDYILSADTSKNNNPAKDEPKSNMLAAANENNDSQSVLSARDETVKDDTIKKTQSIAETGKGTSPTKQDSSTPLVEDNKKIEASAQEADSVKKANKSSSTTPTKNLIVKDLKAVKDDTVKETNKDTSPIKQDGSPLLKVEDTKKIEAPTQEANVVTKANKPFSTKPTEHLTIEEIIKAVDNVNKDQCKMDKDNPRYQLTIQSSPQISTDSVKVKVLNSNRQELGNFDAGLNHIFKIKGKNEIALEAMLSLFKKTHPKDVPSIICGTSETKTTWINIITELYQKDPAYQNDPRFTEEKIKLMVNTTSELTLQKQELSQNSFTPKR